MPVHREKKDTTPKAPGSFVGMLGAVTPRKTSTPRNTFMLPLTPLSNRSSLGRVGAGATLTKLRSNHLPCFKS